MAILCYNNITTTTHSNKKHYNTGQLGAIAVCASIHARLLYFTSFGILSRQSTRPAADQRLPSIRHHIHRRHDAHPRILPPHAVATRATPTAPWKQRCRRVRPHLLPPPPVLACAVQVSDSDLAGRSWLPASPSVSPTACPSMPSKDTLLCIIIVITIVTFVV